MSDWSDRRAYSRILQHDFDFDFENCSLHGLISNIPDNKVSANEGISTPQENGGGNMYTKTQGDGTAKKNCTSSAFEFFASGVLFILPLPFLMNCSL